MKKPSEFGLGEGQGGGV